MFHLAIPINNIEQAKQFYIEGLGCTVGRENQQAMILNFFGHQLVTHMTTTPLTPQQGIYPRHFGMIFDTLEQWETCLKRAENHSLKFYQSPKLRFPKKLTEHRTFFLEDPFYNLLEFKFYQHSSAIFGGQEIKEIGDRTE